MNPKFKRLIIPFAAILLGLFVVYSIYLSSNPTTITKPRTAATTPPGDVNPDANAESAVSDSEKNSERAAETTTAPNEPPGQEKTLTSQDTSQPSEAAAGTSEESPVGEEETADQPSEASSTASDQKPDSDSESIPTQPSPPASAAANERGFHFKPQPKSDEAFLTLGKVGDQSINPARIILDMSDRGAGAHQITLLDYYKTIDQTRGNEYTLLDGIPENRPALSIRAVTIDGVRLDAIGLFNFDRSLGKRAFVSPVWAESDSTNPNHRVYTAEIVDKNEEPVIRIERSFTLGNVPGEILIEQSIENLTDQAHQIQVEQWGAADLPAAHGRYGDYRRFRFGYLDPRSTRTVFANEGDYLKQRNSLLGKKVGPKAESTSNVLWPNDTSMENNYSLAWTGVTNRYFAFIVLPHVDDPANADDKRFKSVQQVQFFLDAQVSSVREIDPKAVANIYANLKLTSPIWILKGKERRDFDMDAYAGPQDQPLFTSNEPYRSFRFTELIVYQLGCAWCTFQWLAHFLIAFLRMIHGIVFDWGLSIIILVLVVRGLLHPLTKKGQISMQGMQKKMAKLQPEINKLKEKYTDNPKKLQQEQMRLYKEHKINPVGCLGMAPMFLQMPIWVALYAMLYFAIELRQEPMFYGVFQMFNHWSFLADLSQPDKFIDFGGTLPFIKGIPIIGGITSINMLPILMGAFFFLQQKYMTPPNPSATPEQQTQQKIMKIIFPLMWPIFLYNAPAGLTMYIMTSSCIGIIESRYIRAHVTAMDSEENGVRKKDKKPGFATRFMKSYAARVEHARDVLEEKSKQKNATQGGPAGGRSRSTKKKK